MVHVQDFVHHYLLSYSSRFVIVHLVLEQPINHLNGDVEVITRGRDLLVVRPGG